MSFSGVVISLFLVIAQSGWAQTPGASASPDSSNGATDPAQHKYNIDYAGTKPDAQTIRVISDDVLWGMLAPLEKKSNVTCKMTLSETASAENPHWICLNNKACEYTTTVRCYDNKNTHREKLKVEIAGFDDQKNAQVENVTIYYLDN